MYGKWCFLSVFKLHDEYLIKMLLLTTSKLVRNLSDLATNNACNMNSNHSLLHFAGNTDFFVGC